MRGIVCAGEVHETASMPGMKGNVIMGQLIARGARSAMAGLRPLLVLAALAPLLTIIQPSDLGAQTQPAPRQLRREPPPQKPQVTMNAWTVGLAGGLLEGAPIRLAAERRARAVRVEDASNLDLEAGCRSRCNGSARAPRGWSRNLRRRAA
jgi:hypothetical protein